MAKRITQLYRWVLFLAGPATVWTAFEMYGLTIIGPQMLFFSISHAFPLILLVVLVSSLFFLALAALNILFLLPKLRKKIQLPRLTLTVILGIQLMHVFALLGYDNWSSVPAVRIVVCILGLLLILSGILFGLLKVFASNPPLNRTRATTARVG